MKKISLFILIATLIIVPNACNDDTIDLLPVQIAEEEFYQNEDQMTSAVFGIYAKLTFFYKFNVGNGLQNVRLLPSDDVRLEDDRGDRFENFIGINPSDNLLSLHYEYSYEMIQRANTLLEKIEENGSFAYAYANAPELANFHKGEALFLRSLANFNLWNIFGTAPLVTKRITTEEDFFPPNSSGTELLSQAISDLRLAITLLPENWDDNNTGRADKNAARGYLLKSLVFKGTVDKTVEDFLEAITVFNTITGAALTDNYMDNFSVQHENNIESLFELQADENAIAINGWIASGTDGEPAQGDTGTFHEFFRQSGFFDTYVATPSLINSFDENDPRLLQAFNKDAPNENILKYVKDDEFATGANPSFISINNQRLLRYADAILLGAEAIVRSGGDLNQAISLVNQIRERARNSADFTSAEPADLTLPASSEEALELIFRERRLELAAEDAHRWYDLRRRYIAEEIDLEELNFDSSDARFDFRDINVNFPLPDSEVILSPNLNQNTGY
ncbi:RagB/SusD family nutrient uptake outer membrane protein [Aquimarina sp. U1-2]|uniref:RagB/SusD family nutrient uptake outer membrane protein n=1 Tax=Aquimarina sp. U1-2 TaxID=2823141 RepID=UPI001AED0AC1|nr:RagB/SusD family nutrient uptake outer membrane protein [Aquimarina sp. U1-2]MBP2832879.1 RagB/SusD family nutrient uptake outer membrane protein [Aquimarina sp. U1-2]